MYDDLPCYADVVKEKIVCVGDATSGASDTNVLPDTVDDLFGSDIALCKSVVFPD